MTMQKPPINALTGGISFKNSHTQIGAQRVSDNIKIPTVVARVVFDPIVIHINRKNTSCICRVAKSGIFQKHACKEGFGK